LDKAFSGDTIDDAQIKSLINPHATPFTSGASSSLTLSEESSQYLQIRTDEKLTINLLQCLVQTGIVLLQDHIRTKVLEQYLLTEKKLKFRNKGLLYLLSLVEKDVSKLLQFAR
jgi:hypothetical protein